MGLQGAKDQGFEPLYIRNLKRGIWLYFLLLIFEGALRKWVLPGLSTQLLIIRDPVAFYIIMLAISRNIIPKNPYLFFIIFIGFISFLTALLFGHGSIIVAVYGARIFFLHFPLIFIIGRVFSREDVLKLGIATMWIAILMAILITSQFYSSQSAWVNQGVGGEETVGFTGALGFFRPSGTFSFTNGNALFFSFVAAFVAFFSIERKRINKFLLAAAAIALITAIPISISRSLFFQVALTLLFLVMAVSRKPKYIGRLLGAGIGIILVVVFLANTSFFQVGSNVFSKRFEMANKQEKGVQSVVVDRFLGGLYGAVTTKRKMAFFGGGLGLGTNVAAMLLSGERRFLVGEGEWGRIIGELGFLIGICVIFTRLLLVIDLTKRAYSKLVKGDLLPWLLMSFGFIIIAQGSWSQPTALGFSTLIGGLILASFNKPNLGR
ncbi:MAG: hypothetical protein V4717_06520 [Bacteroidota bacterium]